MMSKAEQTRQSIIEKAAVIFNEKGIAGTSIDDILKASNVAKGCLYGHFESKDELAYASVDYMMARVWKRREDTVSKYSTAKEKIYAYFEIHKNPLYSTLAGGCPVINFSAEADDTNPVIKKKMRTQVEATIKFFAEILEEGVKRGELSDELVPEEFATKMFFAIEGAIVFSRVMNTPKPMQVLHKSLKKELEGYSL